MAKKPGQDFRSAQSGLSELKSRLLFVIGALLVFRAGSFVPIPGIDAAVLADLFDQQKGTIVEMFNMFSGGALERCIYISIGYHAVHFGIDRSPIVNCSSSSVSGTQERG